ncbi:hypothetical protein QYE76_001009 [Lolium multiflorum]|uniref:Remorin C-terminal domain-containing protein n=1 Tax=Lolium multiflorum TaxID=4521 RepID=A0AAD8RKH2_LOLMU|nr:hypothetical protein QYE76_001009 [Lolium multiflorum]
MGVMSPTKLRMKLLGMGSHGSKDEVASKSPSRLDAGASGAEDDGDHPKSSLLPQELDQGSSECPPKDRSDSSRSRSDSSRGRAAASNANGGSFEFQMEERAGLGPFLFRQVPSKWNDAEKWIAGRHVVHSNPIFSKKAAAAVAVHGHSGGVRVAPESPSDAKRTSSLTELPHSQSAPSPSSSLSSVTGPASRLPRRTKLCGASQGAAAQSSSVSMRDVGTEMTPAASQEQSRSGTPAGAATPSLSPLCSVPASPSASERELQVRTRREIAALGLQLGKMSIASWASTDDRILRSPEKSAGARDGDGDAKKEEYQRKEAKIQEWENCQKSKFEAKMRNAEVQADQKKARAKNSLTKRLSSLGHKVEGKQARVEARRNRRAVRLARQVERIRKTGRVPSRFRCCSWFL